MAGILPRPALTGPSPTDEPRQDSAVRLPLRSTVTELAAGTAVAVVVSLVLQFLITHLHITAPSYAPDALASVGSGLVLAVLFLALAFGHRRSPRWLRLAGTWASLSAFTTIALATPLESTRFYYGGVSIDNGFRLQYMERMASTLGLADMNYAGIAPYYPAGWFWLGGRFANLLGWDGWAAYKPYALTWVAVTAVVSFTLWSVVVRRRLALVAAIATTVAGMLHGIEEPYAWPSAAWLAPIAVLTWHALRRETRAPRWTLLCVGAYVGFAAITYTLHFGFAVLVVVTMAVIIGIFRVHRGAPLWPTVRTLFLRLLPIGVTSFLVALLAWLPYLISTNFLLSAGRNYAQHYLPKEGAFLPTPMTEASVLGALCLVGIVWLLLRCRHNEIAAAMLCVVITVYCWFALSTLALVAKTTLLAFRLNVILDCVLAIAGVFGALELIGYLRQRLHERHAFQITAIATALGLAGAITLTQGAIGTGLVDATDLAYNDYYSTGYNAKAQHDTSKDGAWNGQLIATIQQLSGRPPQTNIVATSYYTLMSFQPYFGFEQETPHYANPLAGYDERAAEAHKWADAKNSQDLIRMLDHGPFPPPNVFVLRTESASSSGGKSTPDPNAGKLSLTLKGDGFPQYPNVRDYDVYFDPAVFHSPQFVEREVGPFTVIVRR